MDITSVVNAGAGGSTRVGVGLSSLSGDDFMKILIKQLEYQDPLKPMDNQEMIAQIACIRELETNPQLSANLKQVTDGQRFASAAVLIGKYAQGALADAEGNVFEVAGVVTGVHFTSKGDVILELDGGDLLPLSAVLQVTEKPA